VLEPTAVAWVPKNIVLDVFQKKPALMKDVILTLSRELKNCELQHVMILENEVLPRVAQSIVYLKEMNPEHNWTRQEIANFCASTVSTVIKALSELEDLGLIKQEGRVLTILNREALLSLQDEVD
jgi:CRP-like cAMP-binding protein